MIAIDGKITFLYIFLFAGAFNDILRMGSTQITLFRILLPVAFLITIASSRKAIKLYFVFSVVLIISLLQSLIFCNLNEDIIRFNDTRTITYLFYYACIAVVIASVITISEYEADSFCNSFGTFIVFTGLCYLIIFLLMAHAPGILSRLYVNNPNDYGAMIAMLAPLFYYKYRDKGPLISNLFFLVALIYLLINDCKLALLGLLIQVVIVFFFESRERIIGTTSIILVSVILLGVVALIGITKMNPTINGYNWSDSVIAPIRAMLRGELYSQSNTSVTYRVNTFIVCMKWLFKTKFFGIGIGNSGMLVRSVLGDNGLYEHWMVNGAVSLHNAFLEILLEFGIIAIVGAILLLRMIIRIIKEKDANWAEASFVVISLSSLLWLQGPSGVLVDYLIFMVLTYLLILNSGIIRKEYI